MMEQSKSRKHRFQQYLGKHIRLELQNVIYSRHALEQDWTIALARLYADYNLNSNFSLLTVYAF